MSIQGYQLLIFQWVMLATTFLLVCLRIFVRAYYGITDRRRDNGQHGRRQSEAMQQQAEYSWRWRWQWSDFWCVMAWLFFMAQCIMDTIQNNLGFFTEGVGVFDPSVKFKVVESYKIYYIENTMYLFCMYCIKCAMICFFAGLIPPTFKKTSVCLQITTWTVALSWIIGTLLLLFWCEPISLNWSTDAKKYCSSDDQPFVVGFTIGFHLLTDLMLYLIPFPLVITVHLPLRQKIGVAVTFGIGFLCILFAVAMLIVSYTAGSFATIFVCSVFEQTWAITVACVPSFRVLLRDQRVKNSFSSMTRSVGMTAVTRKPDGAGATDAGWSNIHFSNGGGMDESGIDPLERAPKPAHDFEIGVAEVDERRGSDQTGDSSKAPNQSARSLHKDTHEKEFV